ncbi:unnamed protein product [Malus baccata var. baccata]
MNTIRKVPFGTWDGTGQNGASRSVPRLVRLKTVERVVPWDEIWLIFRSTSSPWNNPFHIRGTQIYNIL